MHKCKICNKEYKTKQALGGHVSSHNRGDSYKKSRETAESILRRECSNRVKRCEFCGIHFDKFQSLGGHITMCEKNPKSKLTKHKISKSNTGKIVSEETKQKISKSMKIAHKENRAWNIGKSRWNNKKSYPEKFFTKVIENNFKDLNYIYEYPIDKYSFDFAWVHKKLAIEIDGEQHYRFSEYIERDKKKDKLAKEMGWDVLRIRWKDMCKNPKYYIEMSRNFIN